MEVNIRQAAAGDLKNIQQLNHQLFIKEQSEYDSTFDKGWSFSDKASRYFADRVNGKDGIGFVAEEGGRIIGYVVGSLIEPESWRTGIGQMAELDNMFIEERYRGRGIGGRLIEAFLVWGKENKVERVKVAAASLNIEALGFYQKHGFIPYEVVMEKILK